jgi:formylglycine-generating enzyme required for sulfatase activity
MKTAISMKLAALIILSALFTALSCSQPTQTTIDAAGEENEETSVEENEELSVEEETSVEENEELSVEEETSGLEIAGTVVEYSSRGIAFSMITVPGGIIFPTGIDDSGRETVETSFLIGETEVPYSLWSTVRTWAQNRGYRISAGQRGSQGMTGGGGPFAAGNTAEPVTGITWYDAVVWCNALTEWINARKGTSLEPVYYYRQGGNLCKNSENLDAFAKEEDHHQFGSAWAAPEANGLRLPSSKEWELAARWQGSTSVNAAEGFNDPFFCRGDSASGAGADYSNETATRNVAVYDTAKTANVGSKNANGLGLFDMSGNVYEWCYDWSAGSEGRLRVTRGGSVFDLSYYMQIGLVGFAATDAQYSDIGFRVVCTRQ